MYRAGGTYKSVDPHHLPVGTEFHVLNGIWDGKIIKEDGKKYLYIKATKRKVNINEPNYDIEYNLEYGLDIRITTMVNEENKRIDLVGQKGLLKQQFEIKDAIDCGVKGVSVKVSNGEVEFWTTLDKVRIS